MPRARSTTMFGNRFGTWIVCGLTAALAIVIAGCSKQDRAAESAAMEQTADKAMGGAMPASAPMAPPAERAVAADAAASAEMADASSNAVASEEVARRREIETDTRVDAAQVSSSAATYKDGERRFIRTAQAQFRVKDVYTSALAIEDAAAQQGGFVVSNDISAQTLSVQRRPVGDGKLIELAEYTVRGDLTVRVPSDNTQAFLRAIASQMEFLDQRGFRATDAQFDLLRRQLAWQREQQAQLELGEAVRDGDRLDRKADVIAARSGAKLQRDEALIEQKQFEDQVAFSTITLSLHQLSKIRQTEMPDVEAVFRKHSPGFFMRLWEALRVGWYGVLDLVIALMHVWPLWLLLGLTVVVLRRWHRARRARRPAAPPIPPATE
ncbi:MAG: DUF4349 domain-containing protein [Pseudomonadota bacterium]